MQEFDAIVSQSSSSMTEGKGNNIPENVYCHKPLGKVEVGKVGEVEVGKVEVGKVKVGKVGQGEVTKVAEVGKGGRVEVGKIGKVQVGKLCTAQLGISDKPTRFNDLQQQVGTSEEELINSTTKRKIKILPKRGRLFKLFPFYDPDQKVVRVGGRLANLPYNIDKKFPILIPKDSPITVLLIREDHARNLHGGPQLTLFYLRQTIWIPGGLSAVKKIVYNCKPCIRHDARILQPQMGDLPTERVVSSFAFTHTGLDYCGPFSIKDSSGKLQKTYVALFVCFSTKAVHMETVTTLTKEDCLHAIKRFTARRGLPENIYSDNSRTFIGTRGEIEFRKLLMDREFKELVDAFTTGHQINWLTIPPRTPHFGGLWEAAIKSMKRHFYRTVGTTKLSFENFTTLITQIEAILNSRPLTAPSSDANDPSALTPAHFLIGRPLTALPEPSQEDNRTLNRRFKSINNIVRQFWKKWSVDYLTTLQHRPKWQDNKQQHAVNDIVIIKEENTPPMLWPLARITKIFDGNDKIVRVVQVRTQTGLYIRPVSRLVPLEKERPESQLPKWKTADDSMDED